MTVVHYDADPHEVCVLENMWRSRVLAAAGPPSYAPFGTSFPLDVIHHIALYAHENHTRRTVAVQKVLSPKTFWLETTRESLAHRA